MINQVNKARGLTLIELITVVAIIAIVAGFSWQYFEGSKRRSFRSDAIIGLTKARAFLEKCYSNYRAYNNANCALPLELKSSPKNLYSIDFDGTPTADSYTLHATTQGAQVADNTDCQIIGITNTGDTSAAGAGSTTDKCWPK